METIRKKKVLLINPEYSHSPVGLLGKITVFPPPLGLGILAALTPKDYFDVSIIDEMLGQLDPLTVAADMVGISAKTYQTPRAYALAEVFRQRGIPVIFGGPHPTALPEEVLQYGDAVIVGEGEPCWEKALEDFLAGKLSGIYKRPFKNEDGLKIPLVDRRLFRLSEYSVPYTVQTTRGCPHRCDFCTVSNTFGERYRVRKISDVVEELQNIVGLHGKLGKTGTPSVFFVDDNICGSPHSSDLFNALIGEKLPFSWSCQCTLKAAEDPEIVKLMRRSGCRSVFVGIESFEQDVLQKSRKGFNNVARYGELVKRFQSAGIRVMAGVIVGLPGSGKESFKATIQGLKRCGFNWATFSLATPLPGTSFFKRCKEEGSLLYGNFPADWRCYSFSSPTYVPVNMTLESLLEGYRQIKEDFFGFPSVLRRLILPHLKLCLLSLRKGEVKEEIERAIFSLLIDRAIKNSIL